MSDKIKISTNAVFIADVLLEASEFKKALALKDPLNPRLMRWALMDETAAETILKLLNYINEMENGGTT